MFAQRKTLSPRRWPRIVVGRHRPTGLQILLSLVLLLSLSGAHWWLLQSLAWSQMLVTYSARSGLIKGVEETFDGDHPCRMCKAIKQARESTASQPASLAPTQKSADVLGLPPEIPVRETRLAFSLPENRDQDAASFRAPPPVPPPRRLPA
jgi:hypothetical protein